MVAEFDFDFDGEVDLDKAGDTYTGYKIPYLRLPKSGEALYGKFLIIPDGTKRPFIPAPYHEFMIGNDPQKDVRSHFCRKMLGEECPQDEEFWKQMKIRKALKDQGKEGSAEYKKADAIIKANKIGTGGLLLFVEKGSPTVKILFLKEKMLGVLFGVKEDTYRKKPAVEGLLQRMKAEGMNPYNLKDPKGWLKIWKTGTGLDTQFYAEVESETVEAEINGKIRKVKQEVERPVSEALIANLKAGKFPNIIEVISDEHEMWTNEECAQYVQDMTVPTRFKRKARTEAASKSTPVKEELDLEGDFDNDIAKDIAEPAKPKAKKQSAGEEVFDDLF